MKKVVPILLVILITINQSVAQSSDKNSATFGVGLGLPYGGIGARLGYNVADNFNLFGGVGYNFDGAGYNFGLLYSFPTEKRSEFYLDAMYGTNAVILVEGVGTEDLSESYTGLSFGAGFKINSLSKEGSYWDIGLIVPLRSSDYQDDVDVIKNNPAIDFTEAWPILIVVGYNFSL